MGQLWSLLPLFHSRFYPTSPEGVCQRGTGYQYCILRGVCVSISKHFLTWVNCDHCSHYFIVGSITLLLRVSVNLVQCKRYSIKKGCVSTISLQCLSHFFYGCVSTWCSVIDIIFSEGCVSVYLNIFDIGQLWSLLPLFYCRINHTSLEGVFQPGADHTHFFSALSCYVIA